MQEKSKNKCEAVYGESRCENPASKITISKGQMFFLCKNCYKLEKAQQINNHEQN